MTLLDWVLFLPLIGFLLLIFVPGKNANLAKQMALGISLLVFLSRWTSSCSTLFGKWAWCRCIS